LLHQVIYTYIHYKEKRFPMTVPRIPAGVDFGKTAADYSRFRAGFPDSFFDRLTREGVLKAGLRALDLGTGTLARGFALRGCRVTGLDKSTQMTRQAIQLDRSAGVQIDYLTADAQATGLRGSSFELVSAGQCWHWFNIQPTAAEVRRLLVAQGRLLIANFDWIPLPGNVVEATEKLIEKFNPKWTMGGGLGIHPLIARQLAVAGFEQIATFSYDLDVIYSHQAWRGRIRASAGVGATLPPDRVNEFDDALRVLLAERFPAEPMAVFHRVFAVIARSPA
jgi:ubiquinone/menaquinone biosynthesis C-methylase UbiE